MDSPRKSHRLGRTGIILMLVCVPLVFTPMLIGNEYGRYFSALGVIGFCLGLALIVLRLVDALAGK